MKKTQAYKRCNYFHEYNKVNEKQYTNSFIYIWAIFKHQVKDMYASQKVQVSSILCKPKTHFRRVQGRQRGSAITGSINYSKHKYYSSRSRTSEDSKLKKNLENGLSGF